MVIREVPPMLDQVPENIRSAIMNNMSTNGFPIVQRLQAQLAQHPNLGPSDLARMAIRELQQLQRTSYYEERTRGSEEALSALRNIQAQLRPHREAPIARGPGIITQIPDELRPRRDASAVVRREPEHRTVGAAVAPRRRAPSPTPTPQVAEEPRAQAIPSVEEIRGRLTHLNVGATGIDSVATAVHNALSNARQPGNLYLGPAARDVQRLLNREYGSRIRVSSQSDYLTIESRTPITAAQEQEQHQTALTAGFARERRINQGSQLYLGAQDSVRQAVGRVGGDPRYGTPSRTYSHHNAPYAWDNPNTFRQEILRDVRTELAALPQTRERDLALGALDEFIRNTSEVASLGNPPTLEEVLNRLRPRIMQTLVQQGVIQQEDRVFVARARRDGAQ